MHVQIAEALRSVLIMEDEGLLSIMMEDLVRELGAEDVYVCGSLEEARAIVESTPLDCAVLDVRVRDGESNEIADLLAGRGIPFVFSTGSGREFLAERHRHRPLLAKPFADDAFKAALLDACVAGAQPFQGEFDAEPRVASASPSD